MDPRPVVGMVGAYMVAVLFMNVDHGQFVAWFQWFVDPKHLAQGLIKSVIFGVAFSLIACVQGYNAGGGAKGVGLATTRAVVIGCVTILVLDYFVSDILAAVLKEEPPWGELPPGLPSPLQRVLRRCLRKQPRDRLHDIADVRLELSEAPETATGVSEAAPGSSSRGRMLLPWTLAVAAALTAAWLGLRASNEQPSPRTVVTSILPPPGAEFLVERGFALSPDGRELVFAEWYGLDPIHIRPRMWRTAWQEVLCGEVPRAGTGRATRAEAVRLYCLQPERASFLGRERRTPQRGITLRRGGRVWLF